jgi:hypothetical protein
VPDYPNSSSKDTDESLFITDNTPINWKLYYFVYFGSNKGFPSLSTKTVIPPILPFIELVIS